ncbi:TIR domain-containing protein [Janthinobacterium sp. PSPC3-1]|uniref:TIR domain-containing protein n=1 Tax=Janthinobacterium sp. PSPC3-1 TaxID=2804653 RepID=UPI003CF8D387
MSKFAKAFISHSSMDKPLLEEVASKVSAARWEIDSHTFEAGNKSTTEIQAALDRSSLFVLIASANSMNSDWVRTELELAQHLLYGRKLGGVLVFIIDGTPAGDLPDWVRMHVFVRTSNCDRIANIIRTKLFELDAAKGIQPKPFVSRKIQDEIETKIADLNRQINALYVSGVDGIGRRSAVANKLKSLFPGIDLTGIQISISDGEGLIETFRKLYFAFRGPTVDEAKVFFEKISDYSKEKLVEETSSLLCEIGEEKMLVWLKFDYDILDDNGNFQPEFHLLLKSLKNRRPTVVLCAKRLPRFQEQHRLTNVGFFKIDGMTDDESKRLWIYALDYLGMQDPDTGFIAMLCQHVSGHPAMIWTAAEFVALAKKPAIEANPRELIEVLRALSLSLVDGLNLSETAKCLLTLFDELGAIDPSDLIEISGESDQAIAMAVNNLLSLGLLETEGDHLRLASYFRSARFRKQFSSETDGFLIEARKRLLALTSTYTAEDNISFETVDISITTSILQGKSSPLGFSERAVVGSHYLRVARGCYDREKYGESVGFATAALEKRHTLTDEAVVECLRLLGMAAVRTEQRDSFDYAIAELSRINTAQAQRHVHFINGFDARWNGDFDRAESEFGETLKINQKDTHALREIAQVLAVREDFSSAEGYAREALTRTPGNPFVLDVLLQCLIERRKTNMQALADDVEVEDLFLQLEVADRRERTDFINARNAHFYAALKNFPEAMTWADRAVRGSPNKVTAFAARAEIKLQVRNDEAVLHSVDTDIRHIKKIADESKGVRPHAGLLAKLKVRFELAKGHLATAIKELDGVPRGNFKLRNKLSIEIADEAVRRNEKDSDVIEFTNRLLSSKVAK